MSNNTNPSARAPENTPVGRAIALHHCLGETVTVHLIPNGQKGMFMVFRGILSLAGRQSRDMTMFTRRYSLGNDARCFISFSSEDVTHLSDNNTIIYLRA